MTLLLTVAPLSFILPVMSTNAPNMTVGLQDHRRSNTAWGFGGLALALALGIVAYRIQFSQPRLASLVAIASFGLVFLAIACAQLRSGYLWRNLAPGNRGPHRSEAPARFVASTVFHLLLAVSIVAFAYWRFRTET